MSLPPGFIDDLRGRLSIAQVVGRKVMWDRRKTNPGKGDFWAPCPFHQEKSASFHVDDRKGYYYCFGCQAKGDAITFVRETENVSFAEAVEILAREAGLPMPARDPQAAERADARTRLSQVVEQAVQYYRLQLRTAAAAEARAYLARRGLSEAAQARWEIGFAPDDRGALVGHLAGKGIGADLAEAAGLVARPEGGGAPYDRFRGRIIFPIRDARGRAMSLGGRAMVADARAKYINGPETALFDKGRSLFNHGPAREAAGKGQPLIVAEGYMDVIALGEAGFAAVAPLGTAVTEHQLALLWRIADEPVIALDGDKAGLRAALRVVDLALPLLEAGKGLRFAMLPGGMDPDDLIRAEGRGAMQAVIARAEPMVQLLWRRETEGRDFDSPERRAALDKGLRAAIARIADPSIRAHYGEAIRALRAELFGAAARRGFRGPYLAERPRAAATAAARASRLATAGAGVGDHLHEAAILAVLICNPEVLSEFEGELEQMECTGPGHGALQRALLVHAGAPDLRAAVMAEIGEAALEMLLSERHVALIPAVRRPGDSVVARACLAEQLARLAARRGHAREIAEAVEDLAALADEGTTWRLAQAAVAVETKKNADAGQDADVVMADNGLALRKDEVERSRTLLGRIDFSRGGRGGRGRD
jgi:DNA primase